jgi:hypothetical protein
LYHVWNYSDPAFPVAAPIELLNTGSTEADIWLGQDFDMVFHGLGGSFHNFPEVDPIPWWQSSQETLVGLSLDYPREGDLSNTSGSATLQLDDQ